MTCPAGASDNGKDQKGPDTANDTPACRYDNPRMHQACLMRHGKASKVGAGAIPDKGRIKRCSSARPLGEGLAATLALKSVRVQGAALLRTTTGEKRGRKRAEQIANVVQRRFSLVGHASGLRGVTRAQNPFMPPPEKWFCRGSATRCYPAVGPGRFDQKAGARWKPPRIANIAPPCANSAGALSSSGNARPMLKRT